MNMLTDEELAVREREWREKRAEEDREREARITYEIKFCLRFGIKHESESLIKVRAEKKCRAIIEYLGLSPTEEDLAAGKIFKTRREEFTILSAFVSTTKGGLVSCVEINSRDESGEASEGWERRCASSGFRDWIWQERYKHHKTAEEIENEEHWKRSRAEAAVRHAEYLVRRAEWEKKNSALRWAERKELEAQVKHSAFPDHLVDELVNLAIKETDQPRENSPDRRPTFAPPIPFSKELIDALERLKSLDSKIEFEPGYGRLWAVWESPKKAHGKCKGFDLLVGKVRQGQAIVTIRPGVGGSWWTGPKWSVPSLYLTESMGESQIAVQEKDYNKHKERFLLNSELRELGIAEILKFAGAPYEVMLAGARFAKICCCCGRELTDPTSMALGIGPECIKEAIWSRAYFDGWTKEQTEAYYLAREDKQTALL
jgi:hypothetical protein